MEDRQFEGPWLGDRRGALVDWATQRWVQATGRRLGLAEHDWLRGPYGTTVRIGADYFERLAEKEGLVVRDSSEGAGLMASFEALGGPGFSPERVHARVRDFYEHTSSYHLDAWSQWSGPFRPFGHLLAFIFSRRLEQLNVPLSPLETSRGMRSTIVQIAEPDGSGVILTGWLRQNPVSGSTVYVGAYSVVSIPGHEAPCVKVVFPLPNGNATVIMRPLADESGALVLESMGERLGDPGFYFLVRASASEAWVRYLRTFRETIRVYVEPNGDLRTDHIFSIWRQVFLRLHYHLRRRP